MNNTNIYTSCFTGHRPQNLPCGFNEEHPACIKIKTQLQRMTAGLIEKKNVSRFLSGMALGVDIWAAEIVLELKDEYPHITLETVIPCRSQTARWGYFAVQRYNSILKRCDKVIVLQEQYTRDCMDKRNRYMADNSDYVVAVWNGHPSGTGNTVSYALEHKKTVYCIDANTFNIHEKINDYRKSS